MKKTKTQQRMFALIDQMYLEDISKKDFCERESLNYHTFSYWVRRYRSFHELVKGESTSTNTTVSENKFIAIDVGTSLEGVDSALTISYPNGVRLHLDSFSFTKDTVVCLQKLISCLD
jgi:transposase-like protein